MQIKLHPTRATSEIARTIRETRKRLGLRQDELALAAGVSTKTLHNLERGTSSPRIDTLLRVLHVLGLGLELVSVGPVARSPQSDRDDDLQ